MKKILTLILAILIIFVNCSASEILFDESFDNSNISLEKFGIKLSGGEAKIGEYKDGAKKITGLKLESNDSSTIALQKNFSKLKGVAAVEVKFKIEGSMSDISVSVGDGLTTLSKVDISSKGQVTTTNGANKLMFSSSNYTLGSWATVRFCNYPSKRKYDVRFGNELLSNLNAYTDYSMDGIDYVLIRTGAGSSSILIDYILVEYGNDLDAEVRPIEPPYIKAPVSHAVMGKINVCYNGKYKYFDYEPKNINGRILLPFRRVFEMFGMEVSYNPQEKSAVGKNDKYEIKIKSGSNIANVNGINHTLDVTPMIIEDSFYIPVRFISQSAGKDVDWDDSTKTVIIND